MALAKYNVSYTLSALILSHDFLPPPTSLSSVASTVSALLRNLSLATGFATVLLDTGNPTTRGGPSVRFDKFIASVHVDSKVAATANVDTPFIVYINLNVTLEQPIYSNLQMEDPGIYSLSNNEDDADCGCKLI